MNTIPISATGGQGLSPRRILWYNMPRTSMPDGKRCKKSLGLELSHRASSLYAYGITEVRRNALAFLGNAAFKYRLRTAWGSVHGILCPGPLCLRTYHVRSPWAWRNWLSVGSTSSRFAAPPFLPSHLWYNVPRASIFEDKPCDVSLGSEPSLRSGSLYRCGIIKAGRNASAFLANAVAKRWYRRL